MEKDYKKTGWVNGSEPDMDAEHMNNIEDGIDGLYHRVFDDSGTVEGITNFPQFLSTVVNKMNPIAFYKNFKAGMAFVLHAGQLVNNGLCNEPGKYPLDAAYGKTLYDYYERLNSDLANVAGKVDATLLSKTDYVTNTAVFDETWISVYQMSNIKLFTAYGRVKAVIPHHTIITLATVNGKYGGAGGGLVAETNDNFIKCHSWIVKNESDIIVNGYFDADVPIGANMYFGGFWIN